MLSICFLFFLSAVTLVFMLSFLYLKRRLDNASAFCSFSVSIRLCCRLFSTNHLQWAAALCARENSRNISFPLWVVLLFHLSKQMLIILLDGCPLALRCRTSLSYFIMSCFPYKTSWILRYVKVARAFSYNSCKCFSFCIVCNQAWKCLKE